MVIGLLCGYWEGRLDLVVQRVMDAVQAIPGLVLALAIVSVLKPNTTNAMLAIAMVIIPGNSRIVRGRGALGEAEPVRRGGAGHGMPPPADHHDPHPAQRDGADPDHRLDLARQRDPDRSVARFLGVGTQPPTPSWGLMLSSTGRAFMEQAPWLAIFPGLAISLAVLGFNLFGDTLRDAWDPKLRRNG